MEEIKEVREFSQTGPKLNTAQRNLVIRWVAAGFTNRAILAMCKSHGFPSLSSAAITHYRTKDYGTAITEERQKFIETALNQGWADRKNRVEWLGTVMEDWTGRVTVGKEVTEMALKIEKQLSERVDDPLLQRVKLEFDSPKSMLELMEGVRDE